LSSITSSTVAVVFATVPLGFLPPNAVVTPVPSDRMDPTPSSVILLDLVFPFVPSQSM
jgi:hypothetical protein